MGICMRYCKTKDDAMEVVNDGFLKIFRELKNFSPRAGSLESSLRSWIKTIMIHTSIDHFRKNKKIPVQIDPDELSHSLLSQIAPAALNKLGVEEIMQTVRELSPAYRLVFNLFVIDGYRHDEIAAFLGISEGTSKSNLSKAKQNLQKKLAALATPYERKAV